MKHYFGTIKKQTNILFKEMHFTKQMSKSSTENKYSKSENQSLQNFIKDTHIDIYTS